MPTGANIPVLSLATTTARGKVRSSFFFTAGFGIAIGTRYLLSGPSYHAENFVDYYVQLEHAYGNLILCRKTEYAWLHD